MGNESFYEDAFEGYQVPDTIKNCAIEICDTYKIKGSSDPMYIANVIGRELWLGDGAGNFTAGTPDKTKVNTACQRLAGAYSTCIKESGNSANKLREILDRYLN